MGTDACAAGCAAASCWSRGRRVRGSSLDRGPFARGLTGGRALLSGCPWTDGRLRLAGQGEEDVCEIRGVDGERGDVDRGVFELIEQRSQRLHAAVARDLQSQRRVVAGGSAERLRRRVELCGVRELENDVSARDKALELGRRSLGDDAAM